MLSGAILQSTLRWTEWCATDRRAYVQHTPLEMCMVAFSSQRLTFFQSPSWLVSSGREGLTAPLLSSVLSLEHHGNKELPSLPALRSETGICTVLEGRAFFCLFSQYPVRQPRKCLRAYKIQTIWSLKKGIVSDLFMVCHTSGQKTDCTNSFL